MSAYVDVRYKHRKIGTTSWSSTGWAGHVNSQSETLVMQLLWDKHRGHEVELISMKWK